jgi:hypothetical protein
VCNEVARDQLYLAGGYKDVFAWAADRHKAKRTTIEKAMTVATHFSEDMAEREGSEKLASTVRYLETTRRLEAAGDAPALKLRVQREGKFQSIPWTKADYRDIDEATALVERTRNPPPKPVMPDAAAVERANGFAAVLHPASRDVVRGDRVRVARGSDGKLRYDFRAVSEEELATLGQALLDAARKT